MDLLVNITLQQKGFAEECLHWHNVYRAKHGAEPLVLAEVILYIKLKVISKKYSVIKMRNIDKCFIDTFCQLRALVNLIEFINF